MLHLHILDTFVKPKRPSGSFSMTPIHLTNIIVHVTAGSAGLLLGVMALLTRKGGARHKKAGRWFLAVLSVVILTGLIGVFVFKRNTFLLVITMLSAYLGFSGFRTIRFKSNQPRVPDMAVAVVTLLSVIYFLYYMRSIGMIWSPVIIYSTVGYLSLVIAYDFIRYLIPRERYGGLWLYEHILKMVSAFSGILSAFVGTVLPQYQPYSQFLPSTFGTLIAIGFMVYCYRSGKYRGGLKQNDKRLNSVV